ncbi:hypothetical protein ACFO3U_08845 [Flavobacterium ponti]|uniref:Histidine kinase n=1 Tax=Flavobacterium ponti TaxID=665133 RepID=A0ABV9P665_9FLAO
MTIKDIDYDLRRFNSLILRLILVITLLSIQIFNTNFFDKKTYFISLLIYVCVLFLNLKYSNSKYKGKVRLFLDLTILCVFLYKKDLNQILNFLPFILLLSNIQSHSNKNGNFPFFIFLIHISIFFIDNFKFNLTHHVIPIIFYLFTFILSIRNVFSSINEDIVHLVGDLFIESVNENNSHKILRNVINKINVSRVKYVNQIEELFLFINHNGKFVLIKGSKFVKNNEIESSYDLARIISKDINKRKKIITKDNVIIDDVNYKYSYWINHKVLEKDYYFLICLKRESVFNESIISNFRPIFEYIARIYFISNSLIELNNSNLKIIKQKIAYVFDAQNALHFVKNKLSPITSTIDLMDRYFKQNDLSAEKKEYIEKRLLENNNNTEIKAIIKKAEVLIKGVDNILNEKDSIISLKTFIDDLRKNWFFHFNSIDGVLINVNDLTNIKILINQMMFDFVFTDIIENINKYGESNKKNVELSIIEGDLKILFSNKILDYERHKQELDDIITLYNLRDNDEIYSRKTHGLNFIRRLLRRKNIENKIFVDKSNFTFNHEIKIKIQKNENISI